jgi:hypothetical protein
MRNVTRNRDDLSLAFHANAVTTESPVAPAATEQLFDQTHEHLVCRWHRTANGAMFCLWDRAPSLQSDMFPLGLDAENSLRQDRAPALHRCKNRLKTMLRWVVERIAIAGKALGTFGGLRRAQPWCADSAYLATFNKQGTENADEAKPRYREDRPRC